MSKTSYDEILMNCLSSGDISLVKDYEKLISNARKTLLKPFNPKKYVSKLTDEQLENFRMRCVKAYSKSDENWNFVLYKSSNYPILHVWSENLLDEYDIYLMDRSIYTSTDIDKNLYKKISSLWTKYLGKIYPDYNKKEGLKTLFGN